MAKKAELRLRITLKGEDLGVFDPDKVTMSEAMLLEDRTGFSVGDLMPQLGRLSARAMQALVWFQRYRGGNPAADLHEEFTFGDLDADDITEEDPDPAVGPTPAAEEVADLEKVFAKSGTGTSGS